MKLSRLLPVLLLWLSLGALSAQDIHYTLFNMAPLRTNPALTGAFEGTVRLGGIYRGQWYNIDASMTTPSFYADAPIIKGFRDNDWVGVGLVFVQDNAGVHNLRNGISGLSASYHAALNKKRTSILTLGAQYGRNTRGFRLDANGIPIVEQTIEEDFGGLGMEFEDVGLSNTELETETTYNDINIGLLLRTEIDKSSSLELGLAALHVNSPNASLGGAGTGGGGGGGGGNNDGDRNMTMILHGEYRRAIDEKWSMSPTFFWQTTEGGNNEIMLQGWANCKINNEFTLNMGLGWRAGDAGQLLIGADYKDLRAALSYDVNLSSADVITNNVGGFELAAYYIIKVYKDPELTPKVLCPQF